MGERRSKKSGKLKKALRQSVSTVVRLATMGQSHSLDFPHPNPDAPPLRFHPTTYGDNIRLEGEGFTAKRVESFCNGILFSDRPVAVGEKVFLRITELSSRWSGVIRIGFAAHNPGHLGRLPKYACPDLTSQPGYWAKALHEKYSEQNALIHYYVSSNGAVHFGVNGKERGVFFSGIDTRRPLWAMIDLYGNCTSIEFVDAKRNLNNFSTLERRQIRAHQAAAAAAVVREEILSAQTARNQNYTHNQQISQEEHALHYLQTRMNNMALNQPASVQPPPPQYVAPPPPPVSQQQQPSSYYRDPLDQPARNRAQPPDFLPLRHNDGLAFRNIPFHFCSGRNISLSNDSTIAIRHDEEFAQGYVFTAAPIRPNERIVIQILGTEESYIGSLAFGLTNCDPSSIDTRELPEDSDMLLDRPEYWVVSKDVAQSPTVGDELSFTIHSDGSVYFSKNGSPPSSFMHVDVSLRLWAFWDIYGHTSKIRILGGTNPLPIPAKPPPTSVGVVPPSSSSSIPPTLASEGTLPISAPITSFNPPALIDVSTPSNDPLNTTTTSSNLGSECIVCLERAIDSVIYSCGHMCMCHGCAVQQWKGRGGGFCPICRDTIRDVIKIFKP